MTMWIVTFRNFTKANKIRDFNWGSEWGKILYFNQFNQVVIVYSKWMDWTEVQTYKTKIKYYKGENSSTLDILYLQGKK